MDKIIKVNFEEWQDAAYVDEGLVSWNYGQILQVEGLTLPDGNIEVHFSLTDREGDANVYIGTVKDNVLTVSIPDFIFQKEDVYQPTYDAYAFLYQTDGDSGRTIKKITFTIKARPEPTTDVPEDKKDPFLDEVRQIMTETKEIAQSVRDDADAGKFGGGTNITVDSELSEESTNPVQNKVIAKEVIALRERNAELEETIEKLQIKTTTSPSPFHHITDSANMKVLDFGMEGITKQETTSGKNLCDLQIGKSFNTTTGEIRETVNYAMCTIEVPKEMKVTISVPSTEEHGWYVSYFYHNGVTTNLYHKIYPGDSKTVTLSEGITMLSGNAIDSTGNLAEFKPIKVQIEEGTVATEYEPFTNGPSPNPDYPQEIVNAGVYNEVIGRYEIGCKVYSKNSMSTNLDDWYKRDNMNQWQCDFIVPDDVNYVTLTVKTKDSTNYPISHIAYGVKTSINAWVNTETITLPSSKFSSVYKGMTITFEELFENYEIQVEYGNVATELEPYTEQRFTLTSDRPLTMWDKLVKRDGLYGYSVYNFEEIHDANNTGADVVSVQTNTKGDKYFILEDLQSRYSYPFAMNTSIPQGTSLSDCFIENNPYSKSESCMWRRNNELRIRIDDESVTDKNTLNTWIAEHPFKVVYQTTEEQAFIPLPDEEQTLLHNLETYYGVTNVYNEQGCPMWIKYVADTKLYVDKKLLEIQSAMI